MVDQQVVQGAHEGTTAAYAAICIYYGFFHCTYHMVCQCWNPYPVAAIVAAGSGDLCLFTVYLIVSLHYFEFWFFFLMSIVASSLWYHFLWLKR